MQTKKNSFIESIVNVLMGYSIAVLIQIILFPFYDIDISIRDNFAIGLVFASASIGRSYMIRRIFNEAK